MAKRAYSSTLRAAADKMLEGVGTTLDEMIASALDEGCNPYQVAERLRRLTGVDFKDRTVRYWCDEVREVV